MGSSNAYRIAWTFCLFRILYFPRLEYCAWEIIAPTPTPKRLTAGEGVFTKDAKGSQALLHFCKGEEPRATPFKTALWGRLLDSNASCAATGGYAHDLGKA